MDIPTRVLRDHKLIGLSVDLDKATATCRCGSTFQSTRAWKGDDIESKVVKNHELHVRREARKAT